MGGSTGLFMFCDAVTTKHGYIRALGSTANLYLGASNTNHMVITNAGRVGIGTGDPGATLDVSGGVVRVQRVYNGLANALVIADSTAAPIARWGVGILNAATGSESGGNDFAINAYSDSVVASTPLMITRSNGNVGIGGGAASSILDIRKAGATVRICDENRQPTIELVRGNGTAAFGTTTISDWRIQAANQFGHFQLVRANTTNTIMPFFINGSTGNIGIGHMAAQTFPLDVSGIIQTNTALYVCRVEDGVNNAIIQQISQTQAEFSSYKRSETARNDILFRTINNAVSPVRMQILGENGYVGVGARTPESQLHISDPNSSSGAANVLMMSTGSIKNGAYNEIQFRGLDGGTVYLSAIQGVDTATGAQAYRGDLRFLTTQAANQTFERMRILWNGNVGIGRSDPAHTLDVTGTIRGSSNIVSVGTATYSMGDTWNGISAVNYTDIMSLSFTPKQSGTVTLIVEGKIEVQITTAGGDDRGDFRLTDGVPTELAFNVVAVPIGETLLSQGSMFNPLRYVGSYSGTQTFKIQYRCAGGANFQARRGVITVYEVSQT